MSWYSSLLTNATTNISKLQRTYFGGETDGDTEDDTHVCRVLRNYYTEKGQPFPGWLPPDPKAPPPVQPVYASQQQIGSRYGGGLQNQQVGAGRGGLSSLWDNQGGRGQPAMQQQQQPQMQTQNRNPFANRGGGMSGREEVQARPLPSQRAGSYQQAGQYSGSASTPPGSSGGAAAGAGGNSAQEKLRQRLWGGARTASPVSSNTGGGGGQGPFQPPPAQSAQSNGGGGGSRWGSAGGDYEDRFAPGGMYDAGGGGGAGRPQMSANAPWSGGGGGDYGGYSAMGGGGPGRAGGGGLPSGPRRGGLPSGPRMSDAPPTSPPSAETSQPTLPPRPSSPAGSFYAMSDDEEGDYDTITHTPSGRGVKLLYSKSKVYIHPTPSAKDNICGYIALLQQKRPQIGDRPTSSSSQSPSSSDLLLAWIPESQLGDAASIYVKVDLCADGDSPPKQTYLVPPPPTVTTHRGSIGSYAFAVPVSAIYSLLVRPPSLGWWFGSVIINSRAGDSFPALFFHDSECQSTILQKKKRARDTFDPFGENGEMFWGGDEVLRWLKRYVHIERSGAEPNIYLVEPTAEDSAAFSGKLTSSTPNALGRRDSGIGSGVPRGEGSGSGAGGGRDASMDPFMKFVKETGWNIMEKFSKVTTFTRQAAQDLVIDNPRMPPQVKRLLHNPEVQTLQEEFDSARVYLARWAMGIAEQSERDRNQRIWTARDVMELEDTDVGEFELLDSTSSLTLEQMRKPVTLKEWSTFFDARSGRLSVTIDEVKERVFHGGLDAEDGVRKEAWLFLLGVHEWYSTADERKAQVASLRDEYIKLKGSWWERQIDQGGEGEEGEWWREQRGRIEKDVHRTDRNVLIFAGEDIPHPDPDSPFAGVGTNVHMEQMKDMLLTYNEYNRDLGYVQGMSDLLAPIYAVLQDDAMAFWGFQKFMERMERNFLRDQSGMRMQLTTLDHLVQFMDPKLYAHLQSADSTNFFFFFRMLLVWYKREFQWMDVLHLWEVLWTDYLTSSFHLFVALAIMEKHRDVIMTHLKHFDEVLKYVNELSCTIDLDSTLMRAEALFRRFSRLVDAIDKKESFPGPRLRSSPPQQQQQQQATNGPSSTSPPSPAAKEEDKDKTKKVITPELRRLLSRKIETVPHTKELGKKK
ncbi:GTPase-activating protein GYP7 [Diplogelasinospora grovesii]|uniref:GTPase-activating protein GYP7 n=1 Tax=Diplogelasinospora grovesii TaxID=303347 RepID=A0AAN6NE78_9PEZI|nr:GTPase-activating protein GYP7 [Diplogelasinospora grovesii]